MTTDGPTSSTTGEPAAELPAATPAATVIVARESPNGPEVLLLKRSEVGAFAGMWVFPGGRVDADDAGHDDLSRAVSAAVREALEEVALALDPSTLVPFSHWEPPAIAPRRFSTWFFVAPWLGDDVLVDGHEIVDHRWVRPLDALGGALPVAPPTWVTLHHLSPYPSLAELTAGAERPVEHYVTHPSRTSATQVLLWHGDAGYDTFDADLPGPRHRLHMTEPWRYERTGASTEEG